MSTIPESNDTDRRQDALGDTHRHALQAEREQFGGMKFGSAFFGWLTATGMGVILTALLAAAGTAVGVDRAPRLLRSPARLARTRRPWACSVPSCWPSSSFSATSGRLRRRPDGPLQRGPQGVAVWLWALADRDHRRSRGRAAGSKYDILSKLNGFPRIPVSQGQLSTAGLVALILVAVTSLVGAVLGGLAGMRYHRRVDRAGLDAL